MQMKPLILGVTIMEEENCVARFRSWERGVFAGDLRARPVNTFGCWLLVSRCRAVSGVACYAIGFASKAFLQFEALQ